jgi:hypothetical protein
VVDRRYCAGPPSPFALTASLRKNGYLSHGTAAYLHKLAKTPPAAIYLNVEQSAKAIGNSPLSQLAIDRAFTGKQRHSKLSYENGNLKVMILAGKNTGRLGVEPCTHPEALGTKTTNLERTLIDITVRPSMTPMPKRPKGSRAKLVLISNSLTPTSEPRVCPANTSRGRSTG